MWEYGKPRIIDSVSSRHCLNDKNKILEESNFEKSKFEVKKDDIHRGSSHNADFVDFEIQGRTCNQSKTECVLPD